jgi:hypothetical protein
MRVRSLHVCRDGYSSEGILLIAVNMIDGSSQAPDVAGIPARRT